MPNVYRMARIAGLCLAIPILQTWSSAEAQEEIPCPGAYAHDHEAMLEHAALAELTYAKPQSDPYEINIYKYCSASYRRQYSEGQRIVQVLKIPDRVIDDAKQNLLGQHKERKQTVKIIPFQHNGDTLYACERELTFSQRLVIGFKWFQLGDETALGYTFRVVAGVVGIALSGNEEIKIIELRRQTPNGDPKDEELVLGIQGTDQTRLYQWVSSIQRMIGDSCTFGFAREVTRFFFERHDDDFEYRRTALVGHSLGGAVVQYISDSMPLSRITRSQHNVSGLLGYSFNSFGVPNSLTRGTRHNDVHSIVIAWEILEQLFPETSQIGHKYRYDHAESRILRWKCGISRK